MAGDDTLDKLRHVFDKLVKLDVVTAVGGWAEDRGGLSPDAKAMRTRIDLLEGDITTVIDAAFLTPEGKDLREFHMAREKQALDIIKNNLEAIEKLVDMIRRQGTAP